MPPRKKPRRTEVTVGADGEEVTAGPDPTEAKVMVQLADEDGKAAGAQVLLPANTTTKQLDALLGSLSDDVDPSVPYAFFLGNDQITSSLSDLLLEQQRDAWVDARLAKGRRVRPGDREQVEFVPPEETVLRITYRPQAVFRIRAVSRCAAALDGHSEAVLVVAFSPDGSQLATGSGDRTIRLWDMATATPTEELTVHKAWVQCLAWSPTAKFLASGSRDGGLVCWTHRDFAQWKPQVLKGHTNYLSHIAWEPLHRNPAADRFVSASKDAGLKVWKVGAGMQFGLSGHQSCVTCVKWGGNDKLYSSSQDKQIIVWSAANGVPLQFLRGHGHWVNFLALSTDLVLRTGYFDHEERTFADGSDEGRAYALKRYNAVVAPSGGHERVVSCSDDNTMFLWAPEKGENPKPLARLTGHQGAIFSVMFSPDGRLLASASADKSVKLWNAADGRFITTFRGHVAAVYHVSWSLDSRMLVSGSRDTTVKLWSVESHKLEKDLPGHADEVFSTDWSPDGQRVATGSKDKQVRVWVH